MELDFGRRGDAVDVGGVERVKRRMLLAESG